jgi:lysophospholipase L1-like esterase
VSKIVTVDARFIRRCRSTAFVLLLAVLTASPTLPVAAQVRRAQARPYLLVLGDSLAAGYQPTFGSTPPPVDPATGFSDTGYPRSYAADLAARLGLRLIDLGCPGETTTSMISHPALGECTQLYEGEFGAPNQQAAAQSFLARHDSDVALVTIDLGANDLSRCALPSKVTAVSCFTKQVAHVAATLPRILKVLRSALGRDDPGAHIVGMNYYDPYLGLAFRPGGTEAKAEASASLLAVESLNVAVGAIFKDHGVAVANVGGAFRTTALFPLGSYDGARLPENVVQVCRWTHMCPRTASTQADVHPNDGGYRAIAVVFESVANALALR